MNTLQISMLLLWLAFFSEKNQDAILGIWNTPKQDGEIEIYKAGNHYYGTLISYAIPNATDMYNPDPKLQTRPVVGLNIFQDFVYDTAKQEWVEGTVYDPETGKTYTGSLWLDKENPDQLNARGYVLGMKMLGRTEVFVRIEQ
ncbi:MAG: DUF2147 domain-containing protein [Cyclobacteriaceae bacterium]